MDAFDKTVLELWMKYGSENIKTRAIGEVLKKHGAVHDDGYNTPLWLRFYDKHVTKEGALIQQSADNWSLDVEKIKELIDGTDTRG